MRLLPAARRLSEAVLFIHPLDAKARDLRRGDKVKVVSRRGEVISIVETRGMIEVPLDRCPWFYFSRP